MLSGIPSGGSDNFGRWWGYACPDFARQLLSNLWRLEQLCAVLSALTNFYLSEQIFEENVGLEHPF